MKPSIQILLSTYNGEAYLDEQFLSLSKQEVGGDLHILVRDDSSSDATCDILNKWESRLPLQWYRGENIGWRKSFMDLLYHSGDYDYYAFCDQDDIWLPSKLEIAIRKMKGLHCGPQLYFSNVFSWRDGVVEGFGKSRELPFDKYMCLLQCQATGNTMVFNKALRDIICNGKRPSYLLAHDYWVYQVAVLLGEVYYDPDSYIYYRQHGDNAVGVHQTLFWNLKRKWGDVLKFAKDHRRELEAKELLTCYGTQMDKDTFEIVRVVADYRSKVKDRFKLLFSPRYVMDSRLRNLMLKFRVLVGHV